MWDLSELGIKALCCALAGRFFTTEPPGKSLRYSFDSSLKAEGDSPSLETLSPTDSGILRSLKKFFIWLHQFLVAA